jgi:hypothetical protein
LWYEVASASAMSLAVSTPQLPLVSQRIVTRQKSSLVLAEPSELAMASTRPRMPAPHYFGQAKAQEILVHGDRVAAAQDGR